MAHSKADDLGVGIHVYHRHGFFFFFSNHDQNRGKQAYYCVCWQFGSDIDVRFTGASRVYHVSKRDVLTRTHNDYKIVM